MAIDTALNDLLTYNDTVELFLIPKLARQIHIPKMSNIFAISLTYNFHFLAMNLLKISKVKIITNPILR